MSAGPDPGSGYTLVIWGLVMIAFVVWCVIFITD